MVSNRLFHWTILAGACCVLSPTGIALAQQPADEEMAGPKISIVIEEGERAPPEVLDAIAAREIAPGSGTISFSVAEGRGVLAGPNQVVDAANGGAIAHAEIVAGPNYDETIIRMLVDGKPAGRPLRVGTISSGSVDQLLSKDVPDGSHALIIRGADYAVVDMDVLHSEQPADTAEPMTGQYCTAILDKERDVYGTSRVLARGCSDQSEEDALAQTRSKAMASGASVDAVSYLVTFFEHAGYGGRSYNAYGCCGTCDWAGYTINMWHVDPFWATNISSFARVITTRCYYMRYKRAYLASWGATRTLPEWYVGDYYNDNIEYLKIWG